MTKLNVDTLIPLGVVFSILGGTGYVGGALYKVDQAEKHVEQIQRDIVEIKEALSSIKTELKLISKRPTSD